MPAGLHLTLETQLSAIICSRPAPGFFSEHYMEEVLRHIFQNILKRTTPGSRDEDTATKAFNELKKVVIIISNNQLACEYYHWGGTTAITVLAHVLSDHQRV